MTSGRGYALISSVWVICAGTEQQCSKRFNEFFLIQLYPQLLGSLSCWSLYHNSERGKNFSLTHMHAHSLSVRLKFSDAVKALKALLLSLTVALRLCNLERDWVGHLIIDSCLPEGSRLRILSWSEELKNGSCSYTESWFWWSCCCCFLLDYVEMFPCYLMMSGAISWFPSIVFSSPWPLSTPKCKAQGRRDFCIRSVRTQTISFCQV